MVRNACSLSVLSRVLRHSGLIPTRFSGLVYSAPSARMLLFSFATVLHRRRNTNRCINLAFPRRAIVAVLVYLFHSIVFSFLVTRPNVFPPSLSPHPCNLYFCYYWKSFLPGARWKFISERGSVLSFSFSFTPSSFPFSSFALILHLFFLFLILVIDFPVRKTSVLQTVCHCRINLETDLRRVTLLSLAAVILSQYDTYSH